MNVAVNINAAAMAHGLVPGLEVADSLFVSLKVICDDDVNVLTSDLRITLTCFKFNYIITPPFGSGTDPWINLRA